MLAQADFAPQLDSTRAIGVHRIVPEYLDS
jgi:hypothetical protein